MKLKTFSSLKLDKFTLFTNSPVGWNLKNRYKEGVSIVFAWADSLNEKNPYFEKNLFAKQELITRTRLRVQDLATGNKNFSLLISATTKSFALFRGKVIL